MGGKRQVTQPQSQPRPMTAKQLHEHQRKADAALKALPFLNTLLQDLQEYFALHATRCRCGAIALYSKRLQERPYVSDELVCAVHAAPHDRPLYLIRRIATALGYTV